jgi:hypothetical protein
MQLMHFYKFSSHQGIADTPNDTGENQFQPITMKMNASRRAETGMVIMDFVLARIAEEEGFTLWDRTCNTLSPASVSFSELID